jgi:hypothetical protein
MRAPDTVDRECGDTGAAFEDLGVAMCHPMRMIIEPREVEHGEERKA